MVWIFVVCWGFFKLLAPWDESIFNTKPLFYVIQDGVWSFATDAESEISLSAEATKEYCLNDAHNNSSLTSSVCERWVKSSVARALVSLGKMSLSLLMRHKEWLWKQTQLSPWAGKLLVTGKILKTSKQTKSLGLFCVGFPHCPARSGWSCWVCHLGHPSALSSSEESMLWNQ